MMTFNRETKVLCFGKIWLASFVFSFVLFPFLSIATTIRAVTFEELVQYSEFVFEGHVIAVASVIPLNSHIPRTCVLFEISEVYKGKHSEDTIELCFLGGITGEYTVQVEHMQYKKKKKKGIYFVESQSNHYANPLYGWKQGHFLIETDPHTFKEHIMTADRQSVTGITLEEDRPIRLSTGVASGVKTADRMEMGKSLTVEEFRQNLRSLLNDMK
jgi:hypothetical protein